MRFACSLHRIPAAVLLAIMLVAAGAAFGSTMEPRYSQTLELIGLVEGGVELVESDGVTAACEAFRDPDSQWFQGDSYLFVLALDGTAICHPAKPSLEGRTLLELRDPKGKPIVAGMVREASNAGEGWVHYLWQRPGESVFRWKSSYVRRAAPAGGDPVIVGSGRYQMQLEPFFVVEQVDDAIELIRSEGEEAAFETFRDPASGFLFYTAYIFVLDADGVLLVNNAFPENEGRNLIDLADIDGRRFVREMLAVPLGDATWVHYKWPKPGDARPSAKSSFVRRVRIGERELVVGSGVYFDEEPAVRDLGPKSDVD